MATEVKLPDIGEGIEQGTVVAVLVKVGDTVEKDQSLVELETDKAVVEIPSSAAGVVTKINVTEGQDAPVGSVLLEIDEAGADAGADADGGQDAAESEPEEEAGSEEAPQDATSPAAEPAPQAAAATRGAAPDGASAKPATAPAANGPSTATPSGGMVPAAPSVRRLARELGVDVHEVQGSGVLGRISPADVRSHVSPTVAPAPGVPAAAPALPDFSRWGEVERTAMTGIRKATVRSMSTSWSTVPMVTHFDKADVTELEATRKRYQPNAEASGVKLTPTAILLKVVAGALKRFPDFNASIDVGSLEVVHKRYVNVGVAVDTDAGLLVPVVKDADRKNLLELAGELGELAEKARDRKLTPEEMQGGNFTISNLGGIGGTGFTPIVNAPEVAILGVSRSTMEPIWDKSSADFKPRLMMPLTLTYDHRLIDGATAARFLRWVCQALEEPFLLALEG